MADTSKQFTFTMSPGQTNLGNNAFPLTLGPSRVERILISFPPGCAFFVNCQLWAGGSPIFPNDANTFFHFDGFQYIITYTGDHENGDWAIAIANSDSLQHEIQVNIEYSFLQQSPTLSNQSPISV